MNTTHTSTTELALAASMLAAAGIDTIPVVRCSDDGCPWCEVEPIPLAA